MKLLLPKQHGAWAMLIIPFWLGAAATGIIWQHIPLFIGWVLLYLATYPLLLLFKKKKTSFYFKWTLIYMGPAILLFTVPLSAAPSIFYFGLSMIPFFCINAYYSSRNNERAILNDLSAIIVFSLAGLASSYLSVGSIRPEGVFVFLISLLFFAGSILYVKSMIREKKNAHFKIISWSYHISIPLLWIVTGHWMMMLAFLPSLFRALYFYGKTLGIMKLGIYELVNAVCFFLISLGVIL
ncbi:YwiC-like family protein [Mesobacillus foraminis]|uniref:YwiC-like family protein n=1 Tax=Mesobacillus foraminis TaxID=279826 RepID=UPI00399F2B6F